MRKITPYNPTAAEIAAEWAGVQAPRKPASVRAIVQQSRQRANKAESLCVAFVLILGAVLLGVAAALVVGG